MGSRREKEYGLVPKFWFPSFFDWDWRFPGIYLRKSSLFDFVEDFFGELFDRFRNYTPIVKEEYEGTDLVFIVKLGDLKPEDVEITLKEGLLTIEGKHSEEDKRSSYIKIQRSVPLDLKDDQIEAIVKDGDLILTVKDVYKKKEISEVKKIDIKRSG